jgi:C-terminal processing protease CtpA/Prc
MMWTRRSVAVAAALALAAASFGGAGASGAVPGSPDSVLGVLEWIERAYADPVDPVPLLNAAIEAVRQAARVDAPPIPQGASEAEARAAFARAFRAAEEAGADGVALEVAASAAMVRALHDSHAFVLGAVSEDVWPIVSLGGLVAERDDGGRWRVVEVAHGSPAERAGVRPGDAVAEVQGVPVEGAPPSTVAWLLEGARRQAKEKAVRLGLVRGGAPVAAALEGVSGYRLPAVETREEGGVLYVRVRHVERGVADTVRRAALGSHARALVLDLRRDPGGLASEEEELVGVMAPVGTPVAVWERRNPRLLPGVDMPARWVVRTAAAPAWRGPVAVVVDRRSASAAEVVAQALKDARRAVVVGEPTCGCLEAAAVISSGPVMFMVPIWHVYGPLGERIEGVGVQPDIPARATVDDLARGRDPALEAADEAVARGALAEAGR